MDAAVYTRISQDQAGQSLGVIRQREDCLAFAETQGWRVVEVYEDNDVSATSGKARPEYNRMLADIDAGRIQAVIAWHPDRLYRRIVDLLDLVKLVEKTDLVIRTVRAGDVDLSSATGKMIAKMLGTVAEYEVEHKAERWKRSYRQIQDSGQYLKMGRRTFGYTREGEVVEAEAESIRRMADTVLAGGSILGVCRDLNAAGVVTSLGGPWKPSSVRALLRNPKLAGYIVAAKDGAILGTGNWTPILEPDMWELVRAVLRGRTRAAPIRVSLLAGLIYCDACHKRMVTGMNRGRRNYLCRPRPYEGCGRMTVAADPVEKMVEAAARKKLTDARVTAKVAQLRSAGHGAAAEIELLESRLAELEAALPQAGLNVAAIMRAMDRVRDQIAEHQARLTLSMPVVIPTAWPKDLDRRRRLIELVVERIRIQPAPPTGRFAPERVCIDPR